MAHTMHNPTFKRPTIIPLQRLRSPSPPRAFVEPLSPSKPAPIEPNFNYPPINSASDFRARPESAYANTPRARTYSTSQKNGHQRTPSTKIDALAEAALAASPSYQSHSKKSSVNFEASGHSHAHPPVYPVYGASEPPHKRARSELLPSPHVGPHPSRPATSYEPNGWANSGQPLIAYTSRVEEAALLLNFQSGGWPNTVANPPPRPAPVSRPHANSFPQDGFQTRPVEVLEQPQPALLPPFNPQDAQQPPPTLPSPPAVIAEAGTPASVLDGNANGDVEMNDVHLEPPAVTESVDERNQTPPHDGHSRAASADVHSSEVSDAPKGRRGWPKGKPRGSGSKKTMAEKAASKRASLRRKTPDSRTTRSKSEGLTVDQADTRETRRKSLSDAFIFGERGRENDVETVASRARSVPVETPMFIREVSPSKFVRRKPVVHPDTICAGCQTARETANSHGEFDEWISCNGCKKWFHVDCAGFKKAHDVRDVDKYFCMACEPQHGKTTYVRKSTRAHASVDYAELQRGVLKTSEESVEHHYIQPIKDGTFQFDPETFPRMRPELITRDFFEKSGTFVEPICIPAEWNPRPWTKSISRSTDGLGETEPIHEGDTMADLFPAEYEYDTVPDHGQDKLEMVMPEGLTVRSVCNLVGADTPIDVIDVKTQNSGAKWNLSRWADYYDEITEEKPIRNVISLEVSQTKLGRLLQRPKLVRDIDLQDDVWPQEETDKGKFPKVQFYCLMSVADSYTDFHIDFGGSSVYYHILKGKKTFFFIPPKAKHLKAYEEWNDSPQQNYTFLPSITKECYRVDLSEGDTMLIPSGWIHAVWTPEDSLVIGGNFLNRMSYKNQFKVVEIEKANETPMKFRYPFFQKIMWYTAIKYLKTDPLPPAVSQLFYDGQRFEREVPIWADFDSEISQNDPRPGAENSRYYGQAEIEGLPDLVNFIFRTVMLVTGRVEGISADRMKRVNASIPKGYGEPLEVAKTFALWVAWKRGNEDPPAWAHPDAILPSSKEEGPPKKLSERKLKELERKEAIAAWRIAPDRQSARVMTKNANAAAAASNATLDHANSSPAPAQQQFHQISTPYYSNQPYAHSQTSPAAPPDAFAMSGMPSTHLSTPKTSVLGPKRVACDACRKRRIRCKHKDMVLQTTPNGGGQIDSVNATFQSQLAPELHENITVTPPKQTEHGSFMDTVMDGQQHSPYAQANGALPNGENFSNGAQQVNGHGPLPGTNAYVNANIPMTMNGVPIFGEVLKRGRSKACYECRKSKRRCIHDESGNVDPVKAAETPVPRGSVVTKKRSIGEDGSPTQVKRPKRQSDFGDSYSHIQQQPQSQMQGHGVLRPLPFANGVSHLPRTSSSSGEQQQHSPPTPEQSQQQPPIDPSLFAMYPEPEQNGAYDDSRYPYPTTEQPQPYNAPQPAYFIPSLEQIANEVLVDMNGNEYQEPGSNAEQLDSKEHVRLLNGADTAPMPNGETKPNESSADSAVSLPNSEVLEQNGAEAMDHPAQHISDARTNNESSHAAVAEHHELPPAHQSIEADTIQANHEPTSPLTAASTSPTAAKGSVSNLPLFQPPAPLSQSPETAKRQPLMPNGVSHGNSSSPVEATPLKRKRDSTSVTPGAKSAKKARVDGGDHHLDGVQMGQPTEDRQSIELAKMLQQEDLGLRRRSK